MSFDLNAIKQEMADLDERLRPIAKSLVDINDPDWVNKFTRGPRPLDQAGVRPEAEALLDTLLEAYRTKGDEVRASIRSLFAQNPSYAWATGVPQPPTTEEGFRLHLLHISAVDQAQDFRDVLSNLHDICARAKAAGVNTVSILREVAELSSDEGNSSMRSIRRVLLTLR
jgi:hypothetical protein